jgi:hypothetical protein
MNIERFFAEQIREQKKSASGSFHRRGKGVKHGMNSAFRTPYYFMKEKDKKKLNGEVKVHNMYETILTKEEFDLKDPNLQKLMLTRWREIYSNDLIRKEMGMSNKPFFDLVNRLQIPKKERKNKETNTRKAKVTLPVVDEVRPMLELDETPTIKPIIITKGLHLEYNNEYTAEQLSKIFTKLQLITDGETNKFHLSISLTERA